MLYYNNRNKSGRFYEEIRRNTGYLTPGTPQRPLEGKQPFPIRRTTDEPFSCFTDHDEQNHRTARTGKIHRARAWWIRRKSLEYRTLSERTDRMFLRITAPLLFKNGKLEKTSVGFMPKAAIIQELGL